VKLLLPFLDGSGLHHIILLHPHSQEGSA